MAKDKKSNLQKENIEFIKEYLQEQVVARRLADFVSFIEQQDEDIKTEFNLKGSFDCGGYNSLIVYDIMDDISASFDMEFTYKNCEHSFSIADIFNLFDIQDFKEYVHTECFDQISIKAAIDSMLDVIEKYHYDLKKAGESDNLKRLCDMVEADEKIAESNSRKLKDILRYAKLQENLIKTKSDKARAKLIKELEKYESKGTLITYEKRYLAYLKAGYEIEKDVDVTSNFDKIYRKYSLTAYFVIFLVSAVAVLLVYFISNAIAFDNGIVYTSKSYYVFLVLSAVTLWYAISGLVGKKIIVKLCPAEVKEYAGIKFESNYDDNKIRRFGQKILGPICSIFVFLILISLATSNAAFCDDYIKIHYTVGMNDIIQYKDATIYKIEQYYDDNEEKYLDYENPYYEIGYADNCYPIGEIKNKEFAEKLIELFDAHNLNVESVQNEEEITEKY